MKLDRRAVAWFALALLTTGCEGHAGAGPSAEAITVLYPAEERVLGPVRTPPISRSWRRGHFR